MKVGDIVKSLDFNGNDKTYMIGKVLVVSEELGVFGAKLIERVVEGNTKPLKAETFTAPLQGNSMFDNAEMPRVTVIA